MSSTINRRFLDVSLSVLGIVNVPPATPAPVNGTQYIVGTEPDSSWTGATANSIARYDAYDSKWKFTKPALGQMEAINLDTKEILAWNGSAWEAVANLGGDSGSASIAKHVKTIVHSGDTLPTTAEVGAKFLTTSSTEPKLYTATAENTWDAGTALVNGDRYVSITDNKIYEYKEDVLTGAKVADGVIFLSLGDEVVFGYDATRDKLVIVPGGDVPTVTPGQVIVINKPAASVTKPVKAIVTTGISFESSGSSQGYPYTAEKGAKFLNPNLGKLFTATDTDTWDVGVTPAYGERFVSVTDKKIYEMGANGVISGVKPEDGAVFLSVEDEALIGYAATGDKLVAVGGGNGGEIPTVEPGQIIEIPGAEFTYTEKYTLTEDDVLEQKFNLSYDVVTGKDANVLLSVCGMIQVAGDDYEISGKEVSWANKGLDDIGMEVGDVFIVTYPTLG